MLIFKKNRNQKKILTGQINSAGMITSSVMVDGVWWTWHHHSGVRSGGVEGLFAQMPWGAQRTWSIIPVPFCVCVCVRARVLGCYWLSARHDVSQLFIREAMKGPPLWNCALRSRLIRKTEILLSLEKKKNLHNRHSCPGLSSVGLAVQ